MAQPHAQTFINPFSNSKVDINYFTLTRGEPKIQAKRCHLNNTMNQLEEFC